jgi:hypothetical protein
MNVYNLSAFGTAILGIIGDVDGAPVEIQGGISTYSSNNPYVIRSGDDFMFERYERNMYYGGKINSLKINDFYSFTYMNSIYNCVVNSLDSYIYMSPSSFKMEYIMDYTSNSTGANIVETSSMQISVGKGYISINIKGLLSGVNSGDIYVENGFIKIRP